LGQPEQPDDNREHDDERSPNQGLNDVATSKLAIDCQIEHGQIANAALYPELCADRPNAFGAQRWLSIGVQKLHAE